MILEGILVLLLLGLVSILLGFGLGNDCAVILLNSFRNDFFLR